MYLFPQYLERRFGKATRLCASLAYSTQMVLYMGIVLYAPALALQAVTGISKEIAILAIGIVCTFYSSIGGMKAVLITDMFQSILMFAAVYCVIIFTAVEAGGIGKIWETANRGGRLNFNNFNPDPVDRHTWFSLIIGGGFTYLSLYAVNQTQVQRLLTVKDLKSSQKALWLNWPILTFLSLSTSFSGLALYYYYQSCDPMCSGRITSRDQLMPIFVVDALSDYPGVPGLFVSGIFSACLSTVSSSVNSLAAVTLEDYIKPLYLLIKKTPLPEITSTLPTKITACIYGIICVGIAFLAQNLGGVLQASLTIFGVVGGPLFGLFTLGMFTIRGNQRGAITGLAIGLVFSLWIGFGQPKPYPTYLHFGDSDCSRFENITRGYPTPQAVRTETCNLVDPRPGNEYFWLYRVSYLWLVVFGFFVTLIIGYVVSYVLERFDMGGESKIYTDSTKAYINTDLFSPPIAKRLRHLNARNLETTSFVGLSNGNGDIKRIDTEF